MKNPNIAKVLKEYRKQNHYSVEDVVFKLEEQNLPFATKTIYGWESGQTQPDADTLLVLCKIYKIDNILETFGYQPPVRRCSSSLKEEHELIQKYRQHEVMQNAVKKLLGVGEDRVDKAASEISKAAFTRIHLCFLCHMNFILIFELPDPFIDPFCRSPVPKHEYDPEQY